MASPKNNKDDKAPRGRPASTPQGLENQIVSKAIRLAERQIEEGTASAQVISHYLKLGSETERLQREKLAAENELLKARVDQLASGSRIEDLYRDAIEVFRGYRGDDGEGEDYSQYVG